MTDYSLTAISPILPTLRGREGDMKRGKKKRPPSKPKQGGVTLRTGRAPDHKPLINSKVHVFVDDQNLFYGIRNVHQDRGYRIDFGRMLLEIAKDTSGLRCLSAKVAMLHQGRSAQDPSRSSRGCPRCGSPQDEDQGLRQVA